MGSQPSRRNLPKKTSGKIRHTKKMLDTTKKSLKARKYKHAAKIAIGAGLSDSGKNYLATAIIAGALAYSKYKKKGPQNLDRISNDSISRVIKQNNFDVTKQGRLHLKSGIKTVLSINLKK